ncbi:MAG: hypothetical protein HYS25_02795 [Ignavibacteriales bacterium]|nr:hypothetical protein [Ignavibacteriales bacterium]
MAKQNFGIRHFTKSHFIFLIIFFSSTLFVYAADADTTVVRLKNGGKVKGEIISTTENAIIIQNALLGKQEIKWSDITYLSSSIVYDSLAANNSLVTPPPPEIKGTFLRDILSAEFIVGKGFNHNRNAGAGVRANIILEDLFTFGAIAVFHFGSRDYFSADGYGACFYWGPEFGLRVTSGIFSFEPSLSIGESTIEISNKTSYDRFEIVNTASKSKFFTAPGVAVKIKFGSTNIGLHYKFVMIDKQNMSALYFSFGS